MNKIIAALLASAALTSTAAASTVIGLAGDKTLVKINPETAEVIGMMEVEGVERLHGIDYRPGNKSLIGVTGEQAVVSIDPETGVATEISRMSTPLEIAEGAVVIVDVNPAADKLRFMSGTTNHRVDMDSGEVTVDGSLNWAEGDENAETAFMIGGTAYSNSFGKPEKTAMYNIDTGLGALLQQTAPNDGTNASIGGLGVTPTGPVAFDIATDADGNNMAWLAAMGGLHSVDLDSGAVTQSWPVEALDVELRDMTVWPAM